MNNFGLCLEFGTGVEKDLCRAVDYFRKAANRGHPGAQNNYGCCLQHGLGIERNLMQAVTYYKKSADQNHQVGASAKHPGRRPRTS
jgi:TPR repeat protein